MKIPHLRWWIGTLLVGAAVLNHVDRQTLAGAGRGLAHRVSPHRRIAFAVCTVIAALGWLLLYFGGVHNKGPRH